jgi:hypothetical protein
VVSFSEEVIKNKNSKLYTAPVIAAANFTL